MLHYPLVNRIIEYITHCNRHCCDSSNENNVFFSLKWVEV